MKLLNKQSSSAEKKTRAARVAELKMHKSKQKFKPSLNEYLTDLDRFKLSLSEIFAKKRLLLSRHNILTEQSGMASKKAVDLPPNIAKQP